MGMTAVAIDANSSGGTVASEGPLIALQSLDPSLILRDAVRELRDEARADAARILLPPPGPGLRVRADAHHLADALRQILRHAVRRAGPEGFVLPALHHDRRHAVVWIGWDDAPKRPTDIGGGLSDARRGVLAMGGELRFPLDHGRERAATLRLPAVAGAVGVDADLTGAHVLVVGGDPSEVAFIRHVLCARGASVQDAGTAASAALRPDAILMHAHGGEAAILVLKRRLDRHPLTSGVPVIALAPPTAVHDVVRFAAGRFAGWLDRPAPAPSLAAAVRVAAFGPIRR